MRERDVEFARFVGKRAKALREEKRLSREDVARMAKIPRRDLERLEDGGRRAAATFRRLAEVLGVTLDHLLDAPRAMGYETVFLSYGGPDEATAQRFYEEFTKRGIKCFFFPVSAPPGERLHRTMSQAVADHDRVVLLCSRDSLRRPGLLNELEQALVREAREGGTELLIPIALDDWVFADWAPERPDLADQVRSRVVADFSRAVHSLSEWEKQFERLLIPLRRRE